MKPGILILLLAAGCAPRPLPAPVAAPGKWAPVEADASRLDYPAGDAAVTAAARVLVLAPSPSAPSGRRPSPTVRLPGRVEVGEIFRIEIRVPRADEEEVRTFRVRCGRPGLRLLDGDLAVTTGRRATVKRAVADSSGPASFDIDDVSD